MGPRLLFLGEGNNSRCPQRLIACNQRNTVNDTGGGDQFVGGVASEVKLSGRAGYGRINWPYVQLAYHTGRRRSVKIQGNAPQLYEFAQFPKHDC